MKIPAKCKTLVDQLMENDWSFALSHGADTGGADYVTIHAARDNHELWATWHTRGTGTYRLFSCLLNKRDVTLKKAMEVVSA